MHKILIVVKDKTLSFSLYTSRDKVENLNDTNVVNTERMIFSDTYIKNNLDIVKSFFNLIALKKGIDTIDVSLNAIFPIAFKITEDISSIKNVNFLENKVISYVVFECLLMSKNIVNINCYAIPNFMFDKLDIDKNMKITSRCEVLFLSKFMEKNNFHSYSDVYYKKSIDIDCELDKLDQEDILYFFKFNNNLKVINLYHVNSKTIDFILETIKANNKKNIKIVLNQEKTERDIIKIYDDMVDKYRKLAKDNNIKFKINYTKEYRDKNTLKQVNLNFLRLILFVFVLLAIFISVVFYIKYRYDTEDINDEMETINDRIDLNAIDKFLNEEENLNDDSDETSTDDESGEKDKNPDTDSRPDPYYYNFKQVFSELLKINDETVGWLKIKNTNINYPVVKHSNNSYYLDHSYYKQKNGHGWIFMDYRNNSEVLDKNTIIYGHRNNYNVMFAQLKNVLDKSWYTKESNLTITFNTVKQNLKWKIFSIYTLKNTDDYLNVYFNNDIAYSNFLNKIKKRSIHDFDVEVSTDDNILTLSTCYNNSEYRLVVHAKLIK